MQAVTRGEKPSGRKSGAGSAAEPVSCEEHREALLDEALEESFPASDPPSIARPPSGRC